MRTILATIAVAVGIARGAQAADGRSPTVRLQDFPWVSGPSEIPTRVPGESGNGKQVQVRVARIHRVGARTHASVNVRNTSSFEFHDITVSCTAFDATGHSIDTRRAELTRERAGRLHSGFAADLDLVFDTPKGDVRALTCDAHGRGLPKQID